MSYTLILPLVSTGNVPQLTTDLILENNSNLKLISSYFSTNVKLLLHSFAGFDNNNVLSGIELYEDSSNKIIVIQQRSPTIKPFELLFYKALFDELMFNKDSKYYNDIQKVIVLDSISGSDPYLDIIKSNKYGNLYQLPTSLKIAKATVNADIDKEYFTKMNESLTNYYNETNNYIKSHQKNYADVQFNSKEILPKLNDTILQFDQDSFQQRILVDADVLKVIFSLINKTTSLNITYMNMLVYEGDNSVDARDYLLNLSEKILSKEINFKNDELKTPSSWVNIYGTKDLTKELRESIYN
ncbi:uncharacterized protein HGUI_01061 [Hanseniaspora guilliermondii]|uniref:Uncharacterized protein n=1 Tax=Hanseniaspora guilliermondii TaxID=56406 RepID=A0A1L0CJ95_9ASCO|nr:uncharacterized protein HGUI_01061 [Hanseniaspora guilliermondii]